MNIKEFTVTGRVRKQGVPDFEEISNHVTLSTTPTKICRLYEKKRVSGFSDKRVNVTLNPHLHLRQVQVSATLRINSAKGLQRI